jgi:hypothetical protein
MIYFLSFHFVSCCFASFYFIWFGLVWFDFISFRFVSIHITSFHVVSFYFVSFRFISFRFISLRFISFHFVLFHFVSFTEVFFYHHGKNMATSVNIFRLLKSVLFNRNETAYYWNCHISMILEDDFTKNILLFANARHVDKHHIFTRILLI